MSGLAKSTRFATRLLHNSNMPAFTLYGFHGSTMTDRVFLTLAEGGFTDFELQTINLPAGQHKSEEHIKLNPWAKVPAISYPNGFTLYESTAICKYLATKYSFPLLPPSSDIEAMALFDQAASVEKSYFSEPSGKVTFEKFAKVKFLGQPTDEVVVSNALKSLGVFFDTQEQSLSQNGYLSGKEFSLIDIYYIPVIQRLFVLGCGDLVTSRKAWSAWWERCTNRPAVQEWLATGKAAAAQMKN
ncbi:unnamed protein product [Periconia digitata]|uniref:glutathione transferase n=1 Tax=Periconia digitata TaxID=1303443 RepID=A0A9W4XIX0_9PLEO|nr:unnamed protein product [Periconia digitata]